MMTARALPRFMRAALLAGFLLVAPVVPSSLGGIGAAWAQCSCGVCCGAVGSCASVCVCTSNKQTKITTDHITEAFKRHRKWMVDIFFKDDRPGQQDQRDTVPGMLEALQVMTSQLTASTVHQIFMVGALLDAKHQLEVQP